MVDVGLTINLKTTSYVKVQIYNLQSISMTSTSKMLNTLYNLAPLLCQTHQWTLILIVALVKLQTLLFVCLKEFDITSSWLSAQTRLSIVPVFAVLYYSATKRGSCKLCRRTKLTPFINSNVFSKLGRNIRLPMKQLTTMV